MRKISSRTRSPETVPRSALSRVTFSSVSPWMVKPSSAARRKARRSLRGSCRKVSSERALISLSLMAPRPPKGSMSLEKSPLMKASSGSAMAVTVKVPPGEIVLDGGSAARGKIEEEGFVTLPDNDPLHHLVWLVLPQRDPGCARHDGKTGGNALRPGRENDIHIGDWKPHEAILDGAPCHVEARRQQEKILQEWFIA